MLVCVVGCSRIGQKHAVVLLQMRAKPVALSSDCCAARLLNGICANLL